MFWYVFAVLLGEHVPASSIHRQALVAVICWGNPADAAGADGRALGPAIAESDSPSGGHNLDPPLAVMTHHLWGGSGWLSSTHQLKQPH